MITHISPWTGRCQRRCLNSSILCLQATLIQAKGPRFEIQNKEPHSAFRVLRVWFLESVFAVEGGGLRDMGPKPAT